MLNSQILKAKEHNKISEDIFIPSCKREDSNYMDQFLNENYEFKLLKFKNYYNLS